jgi:hypothetical protein
MLLVLALQVRHLIVQLLLRQRLDKPLTQQRVHILLLSLRVLLKFQLLLLAVEQLNLFTNMVVTLEKVAALER